MNRFTRGITLLVAWLAFGLGCIGIFVPVLPTTPLVLLATFLFARSSPRCHDWICSTKVYKTYVEAFKQAGGIPFGTKARILLVSYSVMAVSALLVQRPLVWIILAVVALFLLYLMLVRIPTVGIGAVEQARDAGEAE